MAFVRRGVVIRRAFIALRLLGTNRYVTLGGLAAALGVSERVARRYIESLDEAGIPVRRFGPYYRIDVRVQQATQGAA